MLLCIAEKKSLKRLKKILLELENRKRGWFDMAGEVATLTDNP